MHVVQLPRPKMELALPYGAYRLVRTDGSTPERTDKHPFCMSRVYYDPSERAEEVRPGLRALCLCPAENVTVFYYEYCCYVNSQFYGVS